MFTGFFQVRQITRTRFVKQMFAQLRTGLGTDRRGRLYTYRYFVTTRMTPALRWAATMRAILMFLYLL